MSLEIGGAETHVVELSKELVSRGYDVMVASNGGAYTKELIDGGVKVVTIPMHSKKPQFVLKSLSKLNKTLKEYNPDIVHAHARIPALYASVFEKKFKFRMITTVHGKFKTNWLLKRITQWGNEIFVVSDDIRTYLLENYPVESAKIFKTINGIDTNRFNRETIQYPYSEIIHVSRLDGSTSKTAELLIRYAQETGINLRVVGDGTRFDGLKSLAGDFSNINLTGASYQVEKELMKSDIFVGISRAALEAMSMNMPVVLAGDYGMLGVIETPEKLELAKQDNFTARNGQSLEYYGLMKEIEKLLEMDPKNFNWQREFVKEHHSLRKMVDDYEQVYKND
jgi:glycosyltransferase involved in cell wall biosynthesis